MKTNRRMQAITVTATEEITEGNFCQKCQAFLAANPHDWVMIKPDRPIDAFKNRYHSNGERLRGDQIFQDWLDYFAARGWRATLRTWPALILSGHNLQLPCADPKVFDLSYVPGQKTANARDFWNGLRAERETKPRLTEEQIAARKAKADKIAADFARKSKMSVRCPDCGAIAGYGREIGHKSNCSSFKLGDSRTPSQAVPWEERERLYRDNPSILSGKALETRAGRSGQEIMDG